MDLVAQFQQECHDEIIAQGEDAHLGSLTQSWLEAITPHRYHYHFTWLGRPIIQLPQDVLAIQELIWRVKPDLIVETGVAHGGSLILSASILHLLGGDGRVVGIDVDIRPHNRRLIESHPLYKRIDLVEGSSIDRGTFEHIQRLAAGRSRVMVFLDSCHTHQHVLRELELYSTLVGRGSYMVVFDTLIEHMPEHFFVNRPWGPGNNPWTAVQEFLRSSDRFEIDRQFNHKLLMTAAPDGYLRCVQ